MAKIAKKPKRSLFFGGYFSILKQFDSKHSSVIDSTFGIRCKQYGYPDGMCEYILSIKRASLMTHTYCEGMFINVSSTKYKCLKTLVISEHCCNFIVLKHKELQTIIAIITEDKVFHFVKGNSRIILYCRWFLQVFWCHDGKIYTESR